MIRIYTPKKQAHRVIKKNSILEYALKFDDFAACLQRLRNQVLHSVTVFCRVFFRKIQ